MKKILGYTAFHLLWTIGLLLLVQIPLYQGLKGVGEFYGQVYFLHRAIPPEMRAWLAVNLVTLIGGNIFRLSDSDDSLMASLLGSLIIFIVSGLIFAILLACRELLIGFFSVPL